MTPVTNPLRLNDPVNFPGLVETLEAAGTGIQQTYPGAIWQVNNAAAAQTIIDGYVPLPFAKTAKIASIKVDGLAHVVVLYPALDTFDKVALEADRWLSIAVAARAPTANFAKLIATYQAATGGIASVNAAATLAAVAAMTVTWP